MYMKAHDLNEKRLMTEPEAVHYTSMGRSNFRAWAREIGAVCHFGKSVRYDRQVIDREIDREIDRMASEDAEE